MKSLTNFFITVGITSFLVVSLCFTCSGASVDDVKNNVTGEYSFYLDYQSDEFSTFYHHQFFTSNYGDYSHFAPSYDPNFSSDPYTFRIIVYFTFTVESPCDIYIGLNSSSDYNTWDFDESGTSNSIYSYHSISGDFITTNYSGKSYPVSFAFGGEQLGSSVGDGSSTSISSVKFYYFDNVPAGTYGFSCILTDPYVLTGYGAGIYLFDPSAPLPQTVVDKFNNGEIDFSQAIDQIYSDYQSEVNSASSVEEKIFIVEKYQYFNAQLVNQVNTAGVVAVQNFENSCSSFTSSYRSGDITVTQALDNIGSTYRNSLNACNTVEEVTALNSEYQFVMSEMQNFAEEHASAELSKINTDTLSVINEYDQLESYFTDQLVVKDFQEMWELVTPADFMDNLSSISLRNYIEMFLSDTLFSNYILLPLSLTFVIILLSTGVPALVRSSRSHSSKED